MKRLTRQFALLSILALLLSVGSGIFAFSATTPAADAHLSTEVAQMDSDSQHESVCTLDGCANTHDDCFDHCFSSQQDTGSAFASLPTIQVEAPAQFTTDVVHDAPTNEPKRTLSYIPPPSLRIVETTVKLE